MSKISQLAIQYRSSRSQSAFNDLYEHIKVEWGSSKRRRDMSFTGADRHEIQALYDSVLLKAIELWNESGGNFENYLSRSIKNATKDLRKVKGRKREYLAIEDDSGDTPISTAIDETLEEMGFTEGVALSNLQKKRDQRELVSFLVANSDDTTKKIVQLFLVGSPFVAIAKSLGISDVAVRKRLLSLSRRYDANRFGDIRDYYTA